MFRGLNGFSPFMVRSGQGATEHASERTRMYVSERAQVATPAWPARDGSR